MKNIGGMVIGLLIQIKIIPMGKLAPNQQHKATAINVCPGRGKKAQKMPIAQAKDTECLLM
jgi:hypothetical protein